MLKINKYIYVYVILNADDIDHVYEECADVPLQRRTVSVRCYLGWISCAKIGKLQRYHGNINTTANLIRYVSRP